MRLKMTLFFVLFLWLPTGTQGEWVKVKFNAPQPSDNVEMVSGTTDSTAYSYIPCDIRFCFELYKQDPLRKIDSVWIPEKGWDLIPPTDPDKGIDSIIRYPYHIKIFWHKIKPDSNVVTDPPIQILPP